MGKKWEHMVWSKPHTPEWVCNNLEAGKKQLEREIAFLLPRADAVNMGCHTLRHDGTCHKKYLTLFRQEFGGAHSKSPVNKMINRIANVRSRKHKNPGDLCEKDPRSVPADLSKLVCYLFSSKASTVAPQRCQHDVTELPLWERMYFPEKELGLR